MLGPTRAESRLHGEWKHRLLGPDESEKRMIGEVAWGVVLPS